MGSRPNQKFQRGDHVMRVWIRNNANGVVREYAYGIESKYVENQPFQWSVGNYSCDCNRAMFWAEAGGEEDPDAECGDGGYDVIKATLDGERQDLTW